jgi:hypothetical protein
LVERRDRLVLEVAELNAQISLFGGSPSPASVSAPMAAPGRKRGRKPGKMAAAPAKGSGKGRGAPGRKRPVNDMNLAESLAKVLKNRTMSVTDVTAEVQKAGYKTSAENFRTIVNQTLIRDARFKKVSRGQYTAA